MFCRQPFYNVEIYEDGEVYTCCPPFIQNFSIGNILKQPFSEIWNGEKVRDFRKKILKGDLSFCSDNCLRKTMYEEIPANISDFVEIYPTEFSISSDMSCNVKCTICRDNLILNQQKDFEKELDEKWIPVFKNAKLIRFGCSGEPFASRKETTLIKKIAETYPEVRFQIHTNGILGTEKLLTDLNILNKIDIMTVSIHSATEDTYNKIVKGGNYKKVKENLKLYSQMKKNGLIKFFRIIFVVFSENYKDMPIFANMAEELDAEAQFWAFRQNNTEIGRNMDKYDITNQAHPLHNDFVKLLQENIFKSKNVVLYPEIQVVRDEINKK